MKIQAYIRHSPFDMNESVERLKEELSAAGIELSADPLNNIYTLGTFYLYFRNPYIRYPNLKDLLELVRNVEDYPCVYSGKELVGITPSHLHEPAIHLNNFPVTYVPPNCNPVSILLYTHKRLDYLKLSLNSLLYSIENPDLSDITIFMSAPTPEVNSYVLKVAEQYPLLTILRSPENVAFAAVNLYLQIRRPEKFVVFEEDYILPQHTKHVLPYWNHQFCHLLDEYDVVNFQTSLENQCFDFFNPLPRAPRMVPFSFEHSWETDKTKDIHIIGSGFATKAKFYASFGNNPPFYVSGDGHVFSQAKKVCVSSIHGYHIGWNQEMDGHAKIGDPSRFPEPKPIQEVIDAKAGMKYTVDLRKIVDL